MHTDPEGGRVAILARWALGGRSVKCWTITDGPFQYHSWPITDGATFGEKPYGGRFIGLTVDARTAASRPVDGHDDKSNSLGPT